jgi:hypothetical protein
VAHNQSRAKINAVGTGANIVAISGGYKKASADKMEEITL